MILYDESILNLDKNNVFFRQSVYKNVVNYVNDNNKIVSFVNKDIDAGPSRIKNVNIADFRKKLDVLPEEIVIGDLISYLEKNGVPYKTKEVKQILQTDKENLIAVNNYLKDVCEIKRKECLEKSPINDLMFETIKGNINKYLKTKNKEHFINLLGYGPGLTPLGDDVVLGFIICKNCFDLNDDLNKYIEKICFKKTTVLSSNFLVDACNRKYSDNNYELIDMLFIKKKINDKTIDKVLNYGSSSGFGILFGFNTYLSNILKEV